MFLCEHLLKMKTTARIKKQLNFKCRFDSMLIAKQHLIEFPEPSGSQQKLYMRTGVPFKNRNLWANDQPAEGDDKK